MLGAKAAGTESFAFTVTRPGNGPIREYRLVVPGSRRRSQVVIDPDGTAGRHGSGEQRR